MARRTFDRSTSPQGSVIDMKTKKPVEKDTLPVICERVKHYRELTGMEQKELAGKLGITANSISNWENGRSRPDINLVPDLCRELDISLYELFGIPDPFDYYSTEEKEHMEIYRKLSTGHRYAVDQLMASLTDVEEAAGIPAIRTLMFFERALAAGSGDPSEFEDISTQIFLYEARIPSRANCVFPVNGDSMEPDFHNGDLALVERIPDAPELNSGEIGAFIVGNETYIKQYEEDGLHSLNPAYETMHFDGDASVYLIGRVLGVLKPEDIASENDVEKYKKVNS